MKEPRKRIIERTQYFKVCPHCKKEISGYSESQVDYNIDTHVRQKHAKIKGHVDKDFA